jgi:hypothetical protein
MGSFLIGVVFHRSTKGKGRKGEEHICLVFKTICTYNLAFKHVHGSLIRLFVSFDKNTPIVPNRIYLFVGSTLWCVCVRSKPRHQQPTSSCTKPRAHVCCSIPIALLFPTIGVLTNTPLYVHTHTQPKITAGRVVLNLAVPRHSLRSGPSCPVLVFPLPSFSGSNVLPDL